MTYTIEIMPFGLRAKVSQHLYIYIYVYVLTLTLNTPPPLKTDRASRLILHIYQAAMIGGFITMAAVFFNQFINPSALKALAWRYYIVYCVFLGFEVWFIVSILPPISVVFGDGDQGYSGGPCATPCTNE